MKYFIVFLYFDTDIHNILCFDDEDEFQDAVEHAREEGHWPAELRDWASFSTFVRGDGL